MNDTAMHAQRLDRLAEIGVRVGLGVRPGQEVILTAPVGALPLVRRITAHAYQAGASLVTTLLSDEEATLARYQYAADEAFDYASAWLFEGMASAYRGGAARMAVAGDDPGPARRAGSGPRVPGQPRPLQGLPARVGTDHQLRDQLDHRQRRHAGLGRPDVPRPDRGCGGRQAVGRDLRRLPRGRGGPGRRLGQPQRRPPRPAPSR